MTQTEAHAFDEDIEPSQETEIGCQSFDNYDDILADFEPGAPGGVIVFSTRGYATDEEADAALEAFLMEAFGVSDEDD
jgi:hypothetical protein